MQANRDILQMKYARLVKGLAERLGTTYDEALGLFYDSKTFELIDAGVADMHCFSDEYLVDELVIEIKKKTTDK